MSVKFMFSGREFIIYPAKYSNNNNLALLFRREEDDESDSNEKEVKKAPAKKSTTTKKTTNTKKTVRRTYSKEDIDYFMTSWNGKCYLIPVEECSTKKYIRFTAPLNNQWSKITWGPDYEVDKVINHIKNNESISKTNC